MASYIGSTILHGDLELDEEISRGANGRILAGKWVGTSVAVKEVHSILMNDLHEYNVEFQSFKRRFLQECNQSILLRHPNIVQFLGTYDSPGARLPSLVMERLYCSLAKLLEQNQEQNIPAGTKLSIINDVGLGLRYLHSRNIIHRDLSSNNVLISEAMVGKIGDLGTARLVDINQQLKMTVAPGTIVFMPPEALSSTGQYDGKKLDVFSFGCVMLHTFSHKWPAPLASTYIDSKTDKLIARSEAERRIDYFDKIKKIREFNALSSLIRDCLANNPKTRTSIEDISNHLQTVVNGATTHLNVLTLQQEIFQKDTEIQRKNTEIQSKNIDIQSKCTETQQLRNEIQVRDNAIQSKDDETRRLNGEAQMRDKQIQSMDNEIQELKATIQRKEAKIQEKISEIKSRDINIKSKTETITKQEEQLEIEIQNKTEEIRNLNGQIKFQNTKIQDSDRLIQNKDAELTTLKSKLNKSSIDFWKRLRVNSKHCTKLPKKCWVTSITELDERVYVTVQDYAAAYLTPYMYNFISNKWSPLPDLPYGNASLVSVPDHNELLAIGGCKKNDNNKVEVSRQVFQWDEINKKWIPKYPTMTTARFSCSSISHQSMVIVAGGVTCSHPWTITKAVEILILKEGRLSEMKSYWITVEQLPYNVYDAVPLIVNNNLYIAGGFDKHYHNTCSIVTASLPKLQKSNNNDTSSSQVWNKLPDMPYSSYTIFHCQGRLIAYIAVSPAEQPNNNSQIQKIYLYNPDTESWDYCNHSIEGYNWGRTIQIKDGVIFVVGGTTSIAHTVKDDDNLVETCFTMSFTVDS